MDPYRNDNIDALLNDQAFNHSLVGFHGNNSEPHNEEEKLHTPNKKKGRPKGLKTNKNRSGGKDDKKAENKNSGHWVHE